ncbi:MAG: hypothetical protein U0Q12_26165 [Vicinamibacterales bacterium]
MASRLILVLIVLAVIVLMIASWGLGHLLRRLRGLGPSQPRTRGTRGRR